MAVRRAPATLRPISSLLSPLFRPLFLSFHPASLFSTLPSFHFPSLFFRLIPRPISKGFRLFSLNFVTPLFKAANESAASWRLVCPQFSPTGIERRRCKTTFVGNIDLAVFPTLQLRIIVGKNFFFFFSIYTPVQKSPDTWQN